MYDYDLRALQLKEIDILQQVHDTCEKLGIEYFICFGTFIGAVRHKGFIPWDDDIDIAMTWENYDRFIKEAPAVLPDNLQIQHWRYEPECPNVFAKIRDKNSTFLHHEHIDLDICQGVFIDIFPITRVKEGMKYVKREKKRRYYFNLINECLDIAYVNHMNSAKKRFFGKIINAVFAHGPFKIRNRAKFIAREENRMRKLDAKGYPYTYYDNCWGPYSHYLERALYEYDGHMFWGPKDYDGVLKLHYGDYMKIPPPEKQRTHKPLYVDLTRCLTKDEIQQMIKSGEIEL